MLLTPHTWLQYIYVGWPMWQTMPEEKNFERAYLKPNEEHTVFGVISFDMFAGRVTMTAHRAILQCHLPHVPLCTGVRMNELLTWRLIPPTSSTPVTAEAVAGLLQLVVVDDAVAAQKEEKDIIIEIPVTNRNTRSRAWSKRLRERVSA